MTETETPAVDLYTDEYIRTLDRVRRELVRNYPSTLIEDKALELEAARIALDLVKLAKAY